MLEIYWHYSINYCVNISSTYPHICIHTRIVQTHFNTPKYVFIQYIYIHTCIRMHMYIHGYIHTYIHTYIHITYIYSHFHLFTYLPIVSFYTSKNRYFSVYDQHPYIVCMYVCMYVYMYRGYSINCALG